MLAIQPPSSSSTTPNQKPCTPHLLPLRINHNGPINNTQRHWTPTTDSKGIQHVHFRGRHLHGTSLPLPAGYTGYILRTTEDTLPHTAGRTQHTNQANDPSSPSGAEHVEDEDEGDEAVKVLKEVGHFNELVLWGHGREVEGGDEVIRGVGEWVGFAEGMHCDVDSEEGGDGEGMEGVEGVSA